MKHVLIPLFIHGSDSCSFDCQPGHSFRADWCLDLHGFLSRDEFTARLNQINDHVKSVELMSHKTKYLLYFGASFITTFLSVLISIIMKSAAGILIAFVISGILYFVAKYMIEKNAAERAIRFTNLLNELFTQYNQHENPTVNWKFWWVTSYERYVSGFDGRAFGNGHVNKLEFSCGLSLIFAALFAENALIILEINDALSDLTKNTIGVNLTPVTNYSHPMVSNYPATNTPVSPMASNYPIDPINSAPVNPTHAIDMKYG
ncbi:4802_t:CDS:1 [Cetraspora pellucida]|uniref:4802_t:CDS:1 n=1 Tax=Cetraspora pellucida TaxID=1433469 RepID=A0A9N8ZZE4_9GLOM|nr:4802_t:CDS:1 [Cetraspora pellucida]